jgi:hypothetical protein
MHYRNVKWIAFEVENLTVGELQVQLSDRLEGPTYRRTRIGTCHFIRGVCLFVCLVFFFLLFFFFPGRWRCSGIT